MHRQLKNLAQEYHFNPFNIVLSQHTYGDCSITVLRDAQDTQASTTIKDKMPKFVDHIIIGDKARHFLDGERIVICHKRQGKKVNKGRKKGDGVLDARLGQFADAIH